MSIGVRKEKHHQNRCTIETIEEPPYRIRQRVLVKQRVVGLEDCGNQKNNQDGDEQKPEQGSNTMRAPKCSPDARQCNQTAENDTGQRDGEARSAGSEQQKAQHLASHESGEKKAHEPRPAENYELAQARLAIQVERDCSGRTIRQSAIRARSQMTGFRRQDRIVFHIPAGRSFQESMNVATLSPVDLNCYCPSLWTRS